MKKRLKAYQMMITTGKAKEPPPSRTNSMGASQDCSPSDDPDDVLMDAKNIKDEQDNYCFMINPDMADIAHFSFWRSERES